MTITIQPAPQFSSPQATNRVEYVTPNDTAGTEAADTVDPLGEYAGPVGGNIPQPATVGEQVGDICSADNVEPLFCDEVIRRQQDNAVGGAEGEGGVVLGSKWIVRALGEGDPVACADVGKDGVPLGDGGVDGDAEGSGMGGPDLGQLMPGVKNGDYR